MSAGGDIFATHVSRVRAPHPPEKVYKDECAYSFDSPESEDGLYISMTTFLGLGRRYVESYFTRTGNAVFLRYRRIKHEIAKTEVEEADSKKPTRLAIGMEGGFQGNEKKYDIEELYSVVVMPGWTEINLTSPDIPAQVRSVADAIIAADSAAKQAELAALTATWDGESRVNSKHAENLVQLDNGRRVPPHGWKCENCDLRDNLWLNLTDGAILCGRKFWDGTGGNNHAVERYKQTGFPLAVKLGTITPDGGDVYSYAEDEMVLDPHLARHLAHFGIDIIKMEKTDKTMAELELDLNQREWSALTESNSVLQPVYGPGYTGIYNLGNSCYMNSVMQVIFTLPSFIDKFYAAGPRLFEGNAQDPANDFNIQMAKFARGLISGDYSKPPPSELGPIVDQGIRPFMFKSLIGRGHPEFSTKKQQDAQEFLLHLFDTIEKNCGDSENPTGRIRFRLEDRLECTATHKVKYMDRSDYFLALSIPMEAVTNKAEVQAYKAKKEAADAQNIVLDSSETVVPRVSLNACLEAFAADSFIEDFYSSALRARTIAKRSTRLITFPDYLFIHMHKFTVGDDWVERKLDVSLDMPDEIDISHLRGRGKQPGEEDLPEEEASVPTAAGVVPAPARPAINENLVTQLVEMGFPVEACKKGVYHTNNSGVEPAMNWVMEHMDDPDFGDEFIVPSSGGVAPVTESEFMADNDSLEMIIGLGFTRNQAIRALKETDNNVERAADWVFSHMNELDQLDLPLTTPTTTSSSGGVVPTTQAPPHCSDGPGRYRLAAFISHMGSSAKAGHYVCHIRKDGRWIIFNDEKVALSEHPPSDLAYIYLYTRVI